MALMPWQQMLDTYSYAPPQDQYSRGSFTQDVINILRSRGYTGELPLYTAPVATLAPTPAPTPTITPTQTNTTTTPVVQQPTTTNTGSSGGYSGPLTDLNAFASAWSKKYGGDFYKATFNIGGGTPQGYQQYMLQNNVDWVKNLEPYYTNTTSNNTSNTNTTTTTNQPTAEQQRATALNQVMSAPIPEFNSSWGSAYSGGRVNWFLAHRSNIFQLYNDVFSRNPTSQEVDWWATTEPDINKIRTAFVNSQEYKDKQASGTLPTQGNSNLINPGAVNVPSNYQQTSINDGWGSIQSQVEQFDSLVQEIYNNPLLSETEMASAINDITAQKKELQTGILTEIFKKAPDALTDQQLLSQLMGGAAAGMSMSELQKIQENAVASGLAQSAIDLKRFGDTFLVPEKIDEYLQRSDIGEYAKWTQDQQTLNDSILEEYRKYYFGDGETIGQAQQILKQAQETGAQLLEFAKQNINDVKTVHEASSNLIKLSMAEDLADIETKREQVKTYMTGYLSKIGALKTTAAAGKAISDIELQYATKKTNAQEKYLAQLNVQDAQYNQSVNSIDRTAQQNYQNIIDSGNTNYTKVLEKFQEIESDTRKENSALQEKYITKYLSTKEKAINYAKDQTAEEIKLIAEAMSTGAKTVPQSVINKLINTKAQDKAMDDQIKQLSILAKQKAIQAANVSIKSGTVRQQIVDKMRFMVNNPEIRFDANGNSYERPDTLNLGPQQDMGLTGGLSGEYSIQDTTANKIWSLSDEEYYATQVAPYFSNNYSEWFDPKSLDSLGRYFFTQEGGWGIDTSYTGTSFDFLNQNGLDSLGE
jgi:hypothetical protein